MYTWYALKRKRHEQDVQYIRVYFECYTSYFLTNIYLPIKVMFVYL